MARNKYGNQSVALDGKILDSKAEARRYQELKLLHEAGVIHKLVVHPRYTLLEPFECKGIRYRGISYEADFTYTEDGVEVVEEIKGAKTQVWRLKEKLFMDRYGDRVDLRVLEA
jgi:hypothetical protein